MKRKASFPFAFLSTFRNFAVIYRQGMGIIGTEVLIPRHNKRWKIPFPIQLKSVFYAKNRKKFWRMEARQRWHASSFLISIAIFYSIFGSSASLGGREQGAGSKRKDFASWIERLFSKSTILLPLAPCPLPLIIFLVLLDVGRFGRFISLWG